MLQILTLTRQFIYFVNYRSSRKFKRLGQKKINLGTLKIQLVSVKEDYMRKVGLNALMVQLIPRLLPLMQGDLVRSQVLVPSLA